MRNKNARKPCPWQSRIHILSGSLQGQCLRFDGDRILVGDDAAADLRFDPDREAGARGKNAVLTLDDEEGWRISNEGGGVWLVNQTAVEKSKSLRLRSEDLVRVSESGPDFFFRLVSGPHGFAIPATAAPAKNANQPQQDQVQTQVLNQNPAAADTDKHEDKPVSADGSLPDANASTFERSPNIPPENTIARETPPLSEAKRSLDGPGSPSRGLRVRRGIDACPRSRRPIAGGARRAEKKEAGTRGERSRPLDRNRDLGALGTCMRLWPGMLDRRREE